LGENWQNHHEVLVRQQDRECLAAFLPVFAYFCAFLRLSRNVDGSLMVLLRFDGTFDGTMAFLYLKNCSMLP
jgi:hypothetical protein